MLSKPLFSQVSAVIYLYSAASETSVSSSIVGALVGDGVGKFVVEVLGALVGVGVGSLVVGPAVSGLAQGQILFRLPYLRVHKLYRLFSPHPGCFGLSQNRHWLPDRTGASPKSQRARVLAH